MTPLRPSVIATDQSAFDGRNPQNELHAYRREVQTLRQEVSELRSLVEQQDRRLDEQWRQIASIYTSTSWRLTWPVRMMAQTVRKARRLGVSVVKKVARLLIKIPAVKSTAKLAEKRFPKLASIARRALYGTDGNLSHQAAFRHQLGDRLLSPRANQIYSRFTQRNTGLYK